MKTMRTRSELKAHVKQTYKGNWGKAIGINILPIIGAIFSVVGVGALVAITVVALKTGVVDPNHLSDSNDGTSGGIVVNIIGTMIATGIAYSLLDWLRTGEQPVSAVKAMFAVFSKQYFIPVLVLFIIRTIFEFFWTLLFIIPGIIKSYSYSQTYFIYKDCLASGRNEDMNYLDYVTESRKLMKGHKFELFVLQLSFLGWAILSVLTLGIGFIWLIPYINGVMAEFYNDLAGDKFTNRQFTQNY